MRLLFHAVTIEFVKYLVGLYTFFAIAVDKRPCALYSNFVNLAVGSVLKEVSSC